MQGAFYAALRNDCHGLKVHGYAAPAHEKRRKREIHCVQTETAHRAHAAAKLQYAGQQRPHQCSSHPVAAAMRPTEREKKPPASNRPTSTVKHTTNAHTLRMDTSACFTALGNASANGTPVSSVVTSQIPPSGAGRLVRQYEPRYNGGGNMYAV